MVALISLLCHKHKQGNLWLNKWNHKLQCGIPPCISDKQPPYAEPTANDASYLGGVIANGVRPFHFIIIHSSKLFIIIINITEKE